MKLMNHLVSLVLSDIFSFYNLFFQINVNEITRFSDFPLSKKTLKGKYMWSF